MKKDALKDDSVATFEVRVWEREKPGPRNERRGQGLVVIVY